MLFGVASSVSATGQLGTGPVSHLQLGYFPSHQLGVLADIALGWRDNVVNETLFESRYGVEVQFCPLEAGALHAGLFGGAGLTSRFEDGVSGGNATGQAVFGGAQLQLALTTRLALTGRFGLVRAHGENPHEMAIGLSVY